MRVIIGVIAILLAPVVLLLKEPHLLLSSISISYWTDAHDIFVGALVAVGFFLSAYNGTSGTRDWEFYLSKVACFCALCVALFPTTGFTDKHAPPRWTASVAGVFGTQPVYIHYIAAVLLIACLVALMWFFSVKAKAKNTKASRDRAITYRILAVLMIGGIAGLYALGEMQNWHNTILIVEWWALTLFGAGWLRAGTYKDEPVGA